MSVAPARRGTRGRRRRRPVALLATAALAGLVSLTACAGGGPQPQPPNSITVWIQEDLPERVAATQAIVDDFTAETGVEVELVAVAEDQFTQLLVSSAAAGDLPDVIGALPLAAVRTLSGNELIDTDAVAAVVERLDRSTFVDRAVELTREGDAQLAVPSESWSQLLFYRKDLFEEAGLEPPTTYDATLTAAKELDGDDLAGFVGGTAPGDAFTEQTFEQVALGNDCQLVEDDGAIGLDSQRCVDALDFYGTLVEDYSVPGAQDVDTTRASYFAGQAAMFVWSTFVLDEMAGLRPDAKPTCPQCEDDPAFLARNTGVVTTLAGPANAGPASFGEVTSWTITAESSTRASTDFVAHMFGDGYVPWLQIAPEGKVPVRTGTPEAPQRFSRTWSTLPVGEGVPQEEKRPLSDFYDDDVLAALAAGPEEFSRWGIPQGQGELLGALQGEQPVAAAVDEVASGEDAEEVADQAAEDVRSIQESLS
ncbi:ABC transporter substrate-binding protein [Nocardioides aurantiacus]|uniref:Multiple sugar transport system substrate-binding protein n=1 Tax=Nocardioides aurantiacus TaxID=86796 RepID=A0A3N2CQZ2_9ACTN|nr:extracellular solute-binding protein [Nocardioides aurantiacus]ROR89909.1 multiple sugar transport system substrate-binding protein [Nocardioides aurantiacus]